MAKRYPMICEMTCDEWQQVFDDFRAHRHTFETVGEVKEFVTEMLTWRRKYPLQAPVPFDYLRKNRPTRAEVMRKLAAIGETR